MRDFRDAKAMARSLRTGLAEKTIPVNHSESLELVARTLGCASWHVLSAAIQAAEGAGPGRARTRPARSAPLLPMRDVVVFPKQTLPLLLGREASIKGLADAYRGELEVALVFQKRPEDEVPTLDAMHEVGVIADVLTRTTTEKGHVKLLVRARERIAIEGLESVGDFRRAAIQPVADEGLDDETARSRIPQAVERFRDYLATMPEPPAEVLSRLDEIAHPGALADLIAQHLPIDLAARQQMLETAHVGHRLDLALSHLQPRAA